MYVSQKQLWFLLVNMHFHESDLYYMRGSGVGSFFTNIFRGLVPLAKNLILGARKAAASKEGQQILNAAKKTALETGVNITHDALNGENLKGTLKKNLKRAGPSLLANLQEEFRGGKRTRLAFTKPRKSKAKHKNRKPKKQRGTKKTSCKKGKKNQTNKRTAKKKKGAKRAKRSYNLQGKKNRKIQFALHKKHPGKTSHILGQWL